MDGIEDDASFLPNSQFLNRSKKVPLYSHPVPSHYDQGYLVNDEYDEEEEEGEEEFDEEKEQQFENDINGNHSSRRYVHNSNDQNYDIDRYPKRQKLKTSVSNYEFLSRNGKVLSFTEGNSSPDWTENEKFLLLEVWGDKFLQMGRNSLRSEDWVVVAEKVSESSQINRTEVQCKQMMDVLKRKYKKEKEKGVNGSKWVYFRKMDMLMSQEFGGGAGFSLACGVDSGEYVFMDTHVYLERANGNDEMRDSPCESEEDGEEKEGERSGGNEDVKGLKMLVDSVQKFGKIYEKIESSKRKQMVELERMRVEFQKELELQKKHILERAQAEISKIREVDDDQDEEEDSDDDDDCLEDVSE